MKKKHLTAASLILITSLLLTGCGAASGTTESTTSGGSAVTEAVTEATTEEVSSTETATESDTEAVTDSIVDNYTGELGDPVVLKNDHGFNYDGKDYPISCKLSKFLDDTGYVLDEESENMAKERIDSYGRFSVMLRDKDGNDVGLTFSLLKDTEDESDDIKNCEISDFDFDSVKFGSYEDGAKLREAHTIRVPGGATWDSTLEDLMKIYGKPTQITPIQDKYTYYEFEYKDLDKRVTYELIAYYQKGAATPYRYIYSVIK